MSSNRRTIETRWHAFALALFAGSAAGCMESNASGDLSAQNFGDRSHPIATRTDPLQSLGRACALASRSIADPAALARKPYLQQVTDRSAAVLWTTSAGTPTPQVTITAMDGTTVATGEPQRDETARPADGAVQWIVKLADLQPASTYCYEVTVGGRLAHRAGFRTAPARQQEEEVRFVAWGDSGSGGPDQLAVFEQMKTVPFQFMVHVGDIAYGSGTRAELEQRFFGVYATVLDAFAVFPASGNHDYATESAAPFREAFALPENGGVLGRERWYSFDWGAVHFTVLDTEMTGPAQAAWLDEDLTASTARWNIVVLHRPPFSSGSHGSDEGVRQHFVPLFEKQKVPLVLTGHDHHYERSKPQKGVTYIVTGGGGAGTRSSGTSPFTAFSEPVLHFVYVTVKGDTLTLHAVDAGGAEFDSLVLRSNPEQVTPDGPQHVRAVGVSR